MSNLARPLCIILALSPTWAEVHRATATTSTTTTTPHSLWVVTGPCEVHASRGHCVRSPNFPEAWDDDSNCTMHIDPDPRDISYGEAITTYRLGVYVRGNHSSSMHAEPSMMVDTDSPPELVPPAALRGRWITENDTINWTSGSWKSNISGWFMCAAPVYSSHVSTTNAHPSSAVRHHHWASHDYGSSGYTTSRNNSLLGILFLLVAGCVLVGVFAWAFKWSATAKGGSEPKPREACQVGLSKILEGKATETQTPPEDSV